MKPLLEILITDNLLSHGYKISDIIALTVSTVYDEETFAPVFMVKISTKNVIETNLAVRPSRELLNDVFEGKKSLNISDLDGFKRNIRLNNILSSLD
jgi:hypothetical protein